MHAVHPHSFVITYIFSLGIKGEDGEKKEFTQLAWNILNDRWEDGYISKGCQGLKNPFKSLI